jgi:hypothetical protein
VSTAVALPGSRRLSRTGLLRTRRLGFERYGTALAVVLAAYLLFDRAAAYIHVPGTPLYLGECLLVVGFAGCATATGYLRCALRDEPLFAILIAFVLWGLVRAVPHVSTYGVTFTVRDSALWYYSLFAVLVVAATLASPELPYRLARQLSRFVPWILIWLPILIVLQKSNHINVHVPGTQVPVLSSKDGNVAVAAFIALAVMWLVPDERRRPAVRKLLSILAMATILLAGTQNRGGLVAVVAASAVAMLMVPRLFPVALSGLALVGVLVFTLAPILPSVGTGNGRSISPAQLVANIESVVGIDKKSNVVGTQQARERQWSYVLQLEVHEGHLLYGFGSGPNLGFGEVTGTGDETLRVPHNSHVDVAARLGLIGFCMWVFLWGAWFWRLVTGRRRLARRSLAFRKGLVELCIVAAVAILVNAFFDPSLEGAQVAALLWTVFGIGAVLTNPRWMSRLATGHD